MTKSTITREQLLEIIETDHVQCGEASYLARMALAAMDSEPVIVVGDDGGDALSYRRLIQTFEPGTKLYRHAQPGVPDGLVKAVEFYEQVKRENPPVETGAWKDAVDWVLKEACRAAMLQTKSLTGNSPVIPDSYVMVPMTLTAENGAKGALSGEFSETKFVNCPECFGDDECETCDGSGRIEITLPVTWTTIKEIWAKGMEHFAAAQQEVKGE
ncbi:hypothetical protein PO650_05255 [Klebsiella pneumoniae]